MKINQKMRKTLIILTAVVVCCLLAGPLGAQEKAVQQPDTVVQNLYEYVTFPAGTTPDWEKVKALFVDSAVITLRTSRTDLTVFSLEGFVQDFINFIQRAKVKETGFQEKIIRMKSFPVGDIAQIMVLYEVSIPGRNMPPQQGIDIFSLIRKNGQWKIQSIINEIPRIGVPIPEILQEKEDGKIE